MTIHVSYKQTIYYQAKVYYPFTHKKQKNLDVILAVTITNLGSSKVAGLINHTQSSSSKNFCFKTRFRT